MRILFHGPGTASHLPDIRLPGTTGLSHLITGKLSSLGATQSLTSNRGNLIHGEAPSRIFRCNRNKSAFANLNVLHRRLGDRIGEVLSSHFDLLVISAANFISTSRELERLRDALNAIGDSVPFVVLGGGLQGEPELSQLHPSIQEVLDIYNRRALVFGVRGYETEAWLHKYGFTNARALGCPSLLVFPSSIMSLNFSEVVAKGTDANLLTAGYLTHSGGRNYGRGVKLAKAIQGYRSSYVFQDEFFGYRELMEQPGLFNDATCTVNNDVLNHFLTKEAGLPVNISNYYYFSETSAWRQAALSHDVYLGDRFHGGVAALQAGRPAIFLCQDNRVAEMTDFYNLPRLTLDELISQQVENVIESRLNADTLNQIKKTYVKRRADFKAEMDKHNLPLVMPKIH